MFSPISLTEMDEVKLMKRMDTKFIVNTDKILVLLNHIKSDYKILEINGNRLMTYDSLYYDTDGLNFYLDHHNKIANRIKIRKRNYVESNISFLEIKQKNNKGVTIKTRIPLQSFSKEMSQEGHSFIKEITNKDLTLHHSISNRFYRLTLVSIENEERVTIDFNLSYDNQLYNKKLAIIELKQEKLNRNSKLFQALKSIGINPFSISKYCIGMATTYPDLKQNFFKHKMLTITKKTA
ncbi:MAG: hypothetical protein ACI9JN_002316 [Bacteroidia bacterium]|jgi:hypothetical protein